jgi:hypothetical protein
LRSAAFHFTSLRVWAPLREGPDVTVWEFNTGARPRIWSFVAFAIARMSG